MRLPLNQRHMSAMALKLYQSCPLRFKFRYVDNLYLVPPSGGTEEDRRALQRGEHFHLMARRYYAGLEPATIADLVEQRELDHWLGRLQGFLPRTPERAFYPELELRLNRPDLRLVAKFDLVVVESDGRATVYDWKTERRPPHRQYLASSPQTLVYRYMLCAAGSGYSPLGRFEPEQIAMVYWNPLYPHKWERMEYDQSQYRRDEERLRELIGRILSHGLDDFPSAVDRSVCPRCEFRMLCHGHRTEEAPEEELLAEEQERLADEESAWERPVDLP